MELPQAPCGSGLHPVTLVVISAHELAASSTFDSTLFGWQMMKMSAELMAAGATAGPSIALRAKVPDGFPGVVPYIGVSDVAATLVAIEAAGGKRQGDAMSMPGMGTFGYFTDPSSTTMALIGP